MGRFWLYRCNAPGWFPNNSRSFRTEGDLSAVVSGVASLRRFEAPAFRAISADDLDQMRQPLHFQRSLDSTRNPPVAARSWRHSPLEMLPLMHRRCNPPRRTSQGDGNCPRSPRGPACLDRYPSVARNPPKHPSKTRPDCSGACPRSSSLPMVRSHPQVHLETESPEGRKSRGR